MKKFIMAFATMLFSVALIAQTNLSEHVRSKTLPDGIIEVTYTNKSDKHFIQSNDGIHFVITTVGRSKVIHASIVPDNNGNKNVTIGDIKFTVNSSGYVGNLSTTNTYTSSVSSATSCIGRAQEQCRQEWACTIVCAAGFSPGCILGWAIGCAAKVLE